MYFLFLTILTSFSLAYFIVRIWYIIHTRYKIRVDQPSVVSVRLLVKSRLLVKWGGQKLTRRFRIARGPAHRTPSLFDGQVHIAVLSTAVATLHIRFSGLTHLRAKRLRAFPTSPNPGNCFPVSVCLPVSLDSTSAALWHLSLSLSGLCHSAQCPHSPFTWSQTAECPSFSRLSILLCAVYTVFSSSVHPRALRLFWRLGCGECGRAPIPSSSCVYYLRRGTRKWNCRIAWEFCF